MAVGLIHEIGAFSFLCIVFSVAQLHGAIVSPELLIITK